LQFRSWPDLKSPLHLTFGRPACLIHWCCFSQYIEDCLAH
jgi:hypothetical protein